MRFILLPLLFCSLMVAGQYKPYISVGPSVSSGTVTYGSEIGVYKDKMWYSVVGEVYKDAQGHNQYYTGPKIYYNFYSPAKFVDFYTYVAAKLHVIQHPDIVVESGVASVFNIGKHFALQLSLSSPVPENTILFKPIYISTGVSINWWINP